MTSLLLVILASALWGIVASEAEISLFLTLAVAGVIGFVISLLFPWSF